MKQDRGRPRVSFSARLPDTSHYNQDRTMQQIIDFILEVEKLKGVTRKTRPLGLDHYENSAEHSWQLASSPYHWNALPNRLWT